MKLSKELLLLSIVSIVFLAGCARGPSAPAGAGVIIQSFAPDLGEVDGGTEVAFTLAVKNTGEKEASNIVAEMFGLSSEWKKDATNPFDSKSQPIGKLAGVDPSVGFEGEDGTADFEVIAPPSKTTDITYDASVRLSYTYETESTTLLRIVQANYLKTNPNVQRGIVSSSSTGGPLLVTVVARTPVVSGTQSPRIQFEIQNAGGGHVFGAFDSNKVKMDTLDRLTSIEISSAGKTINCAGKSGTGTLTLSDDVSVGQGNTVSLRLVGGKSKIISCDVSTGTITNFQDLSVTMKIKYNYFVDSASSVTVLKGLQ